MTASPESTRPATRRSLRENARAYAGSRPEPGSAPAAPETAGSAAPSADAGARVAPSASTPRDAGPQTPPHPTDPASPASPEAGITVDTLFGAGPGAEARAGSGARSGAASGADARTGSGAEGDPHDDSGWSDESGDDPTAEPEFLRDAAPPASGSASAAASTVRDGAAGGDGEGPRSDAAREAAPLTAWADDEHPSTALAWLDPQTVAAASATEAAAAPALFEGARLRSAGRRARVAVPLGAIAALCAAYVTGTLIVPLDNVVPTVQPAQVMVDDAPAAVATWPERGSAAVTVQGLSPLASTSDRDEIASITKVATVMMVLDELPLNVGEQGPSFEFTRADQRDYWSYRWSNQSSLDVPVGGSLTEYQLLQGILLGSANNYADRLSDELWGSDRGYADASAKWLRDHGIEGITLESPSGFDEDNVATPGSLLRLGELAMRNPVFAEIVATRSAEIPGAGTVTNTNQMLEDPGVIGVKTGTLSHWNLLTAKEVTVGDTTVRLFASVLGQDSNADRLAVTRSLLAEVEKTLAEQPVSVPKGTVVGQVTTEWGDRVDLVTTADARVVLWNGASATATPALELGSRTTAGAEAGTVTVQGPIDSVETPVALAREVTAPSIWWRLTHPLELFGIDEQ